MQLIYEYRGQRHAVDLKNGRMMIGRSDSCDLSLQAEGVSGQHVLLEIDGEFVELFDQQSTHGTVVNGRPVKNHILAPGDRIRLGAVHLLLQDPANPVAPREPSQSRQRSSLAQRGSRSQRSESKQRSRADQRARPGPSGVSMRGSVGGNNPLLGRFQLRNVDSGEVFVLVRNLETLGSREKNSIVLQGGGISRYHCKVEVKDGCWRVKDLDSRNGVLFAPNEDSEPQRVPEGLLRPGSRVQIGDVLLAFEERDAHLRPKTPPPSQAKASGAAKPGAAEAESQISPALGAVALVFVIVLVGLLYYASSQGGANPNEGLVDESFTSFEERIIYAVEKLEKGDVEQAQRIMEDVSLEFRDRKATVPLRTIVKIWNRRSKDMEIEGWKKLSSAFVKLEGINTPLKVDRFVRKHSKQTQINTTAIVLYRKANTHVNAGNALLGESKVLQACQEYYKALTVLVRVPRKSIVGDDAAKSYKSTKLAAYDALMSEAGRQKKALNWSQAKEFFSYALAYAPDEATKKRIEKSIVLAGRNRLDESNYERALRLLGTKNPDKYPQAMDLLRSIDSESDIYENSKNWLEYAQRDFYTRRATQHYRAGNGKKALEFIRKALDSKGIQAPDRSRLTANQSRWSKVVKAFENGEKAIDRGQFSKATKEFEFVIANVNKARNAYGRLAEAKLEEITKRKNMSAPEIFKEAQQALAAFDYELVHTMLSRLRSQTSGRGKLYKRAIILIDKHERRYNLVKKARRVELLAKSSEYRQQERICRVLKEFLPSSDSRRKQAADVYSSLLARR